MHRQSVEIQSRKNDLLNTIDGNKASTESFMLPSIKKGRAIFAPSPHHKDPSVIMANCSITQRYLTRNVF